MVRTVSSGDIQLRICTAAEMKFYFDSFFQKVYEVMFYETYVVFEFPFCVIRIVGYLELLVVNVFKIDFLLQK